VSKPIRNAFIPNGSDIDDLLPYMHAFLSAVTTMSVVAAADKAGVSRDSLYAWRKQFPDFAHDWDMRVDRAWVDSFFDRDKARPRGRPRNNRPVAVASRPIVVRWGQRRNAEAARRRQATGGASNV
jgi:transposase-like protein